MSGARTGALGFWTIVNNVRMRVRGRMIIANRYLPGGYLLLPTLSGRGMGYLRRYLVYLVATVGVYNLSIHLVY